MTVENIAPGSIAGYADLETLAAQKREITKWALDRKLYQDLQLIDECIELEYPILLSYTDLLAGTVYDSESTTRQRARQVSSAAFHFGVLLGEHILPADEFSFNFKSISEPTSLTELYEYIMHGSDRYLQHRPVLDNFIGRYMPDISPQPNYRAGAEIIAAHSLMLIESSQYQKFIDRQAAQLVRSLS